MKTMTPEATELAANQRQLAKMAASYSAASGAERDEIAREIDRIFPFAASVVCKTGRRYGLWADRARG